MRRRPALHARYALRAQYALHAAWWPAEKVGEASAGGGKINPKKRAESANRSEYGRTGFLNES